MFVKRNRNLWTALFGPVWLPKNEREIPLVNINTSGYVVMLSATANQEWQFQWLNNKIWFITEASLTTSPLPLHWTEVWSLPVPEKVDPFMKTLIRVYGSSFLSSICGKCGSVWINISKRFRIILFAAVRALFVEVGVDFSAWIVCTILH